MLLASSNGDFVELKVAGYQFAQTPGGSAGGWDDNWLIISGRVKRGEDSWVFRDPCLTTWEAHELLGWLQSDAAFTKRIEFTEPNLAFEVATDDSPQVTILVTLRGEAAPPTASDEIRWGAGCTLALDIARDSLAPTASAWESELSDYPSR
ncbi:WapI family immunity protein [Microbacterium flavescens]|uniref:WapI family immunity protein n=1 Tax=Microbacterium flavescens TaxID=69366 RepID=UPI001BDF44DA|nr:hypothetical protein [Microbacterium flavescens]BFF09222.1 hypothetical protein GCM10025699_05250 [Microbacterium flavescens]